MNFTLNPKSISSNIIALTETNFNYSSRNNSFIDIISSFFNTEDVSKLSIINKLATLKAQTRTPDEDSIVEEFKDSEENPVTTLLVDLQKHYFSIDSTYRFEDVIAVFELPSYENKIFEIFKATIDDYKAEGALAEMYEKFDKLITENKELLKNNQPVINNTDIS